MSGAKAWARPIILLVWSVLLTGLTGILGFAPLRAFRYKVGAFPFFAVSVLATALLFLLKVPSLAVGFFILAVMTFMMAEAEDGGFSYLGAGVVAVLGGALISAFGFLMWVRVLGADWNKALKAKFEAQMNLFLNSGIVANKQLPIQDLYSQIPSIFICTLIVAVGIALVSEKPIFRWLGINRTKGKPLTNFKLPDAVVWFTIFSILISFVDMGWPSMMVLGANFLNVCAVLFFFQGLAVLCKYFEVFRVSGTWRTLWLVIFISQLFFVLGIVGFVDFWIDFRAYFVQKAGDILKRSKQ